MGDIQLTGAKKALLDEYERAIKDLVKLIEPLTNDELSIIRDTQTSDPDCRSIQTILTHVVNSGFGYTVYIENHLGEKTVRPEKLNLDTPPQYIERLWAMFGYCVAFFKKHPTIELEEMDNSKKILTNWGQRFDIDQLMEHAIVHILRHRRQIENFLKK